MNISRPVRQATWVGYGSDVPTSRGAVRPLALATPAEAEPATAAATATPTANRLAKFMYPQSCADNFPRRMANTAFRSVSPPTAKPAADQHGGPARCGYGYCLRYTG